MANFKCVMAETLWESGLGRKTFDLQQDKTGSVICHTLHSKLSVADCWSMTGEQLWESVGREIMLSDIKNDKCKYLGFLSCTQYSNPTGLTPSSYNQVLKMTKGHVAIGGGGLALFGTGSLWTWPTTLAQVQSRLLSTEKIDPDILMDDSAYRGTVGGSFATTLGSVLHEVGHCFDLGHTDEGIMARGFDDMDLFFTLGSAVVRKRGHLDPCSSYQNDDDISSVSIGRSNSCTDGDYSPRFTSIRRSDSISKYLEGYSQKRLRYQQNKEASGVFWTSSCAMMLSKQKWMNSSTCSNHKETICGVEVCCELGVLEIRGEGGKVIKFWTTDNQDLNPETLSAGNSAATNILAITNCGNVFKKSLP